MTGRLVFGLVLWLAAVRGQAVDFTQDVQPILEMSCVSCHGGERPKGGLSLNTKQDAFAEADSGVAIVPGKPQESSLYTLTILPADDDELMPPSNKGGPLPKEQTEILREWIEQGAEWPAGVTLEEAQRVSFVQDVQPILEMNCLSCHGGERPKGGLSLNTKQDAFAEADSGVTIIPGKPQESSLYTLTILPADHDDLMPPSNKGGPMPKEETEILRRWIEQGADWPAGVTLEQVQRVNFVEIQPILEFNCVSCHRDGHADGGLALDTKEAAMAGGDSGPAIVPGKSSASLLYTSTILPEEHPDLMPPSSKGGPMDRELTDRLWKWIDQGASWPEGLRLVARKQVAEGEDEIPLIQDIREQLMAKHVPVEEAAMKPYKEEIPGTAVSFQMVPIPGGKFTMGSPPSEPGRQPDEGPQHEVVIGPFWMQQHEVTWDEYEMFMYPTEEQKIREMRKQDPAENILADAVTRPTTPYVEMSFGMGKYGYPAISMTHYAVRNYCKWLSAKTGHFYRLPTEAEWEYAARAGTTTAYSFGDDPSKLGEYAWYAENSNWKYQKVGTKKPNPWGLHDMHGNVAEWTADQYSPNYYEQFRDTVASNPWNEPKALYPRVARGGSWDDDPEALRSAARRASDPLWKMQDPQLPKSLWYHTDAQFLGFRVIRPLEVPPVEEMQKYWTGEIQRD